MSLSSPFLRPLCLCVNARCPLPPPNPRAPFPLLSVTGREQAKRRRLQPLPPAPSPQMPFAVAAGLLLQYVTAFCLSTPPPPRAPSIQGWLRAAAVQILGCASRLAPLPPASALYYLSGKQQRVREEEEEGGGKAADRWLSSPMGACSSPRLGLGQRQFGTSGSSHAGGGGDQSRASPPPPLPRRCRRRVSSIPRSVPSDWSGILRLLDMGGGGL